MWKLIAGRGELGNINWGYDDSISEKIVKKWYKNLKNHIGEKVLLSGGGGHDYNFGKLTDVKMDTFNNKPAIKVKLENLDPPIAGRQTFEPWINSWQISVLLDK